jgi:predicted Zn-dependent peptidase
MRAKTETLDNGLNVIAASLPMLETVGISIGVKYGFVDDPKGKEGISHYLEHMIFKGTKKRSWKDIDGTFKMLGAAHNAFTEYEATVFIAQVHKSMFGRCMELMSDIITNSTLLQKEFLTERGPILNEVMIEHDMPMELSKDYMLKVLFKKHPARNMAYSNEKEINAINRNDIEKIYRKYYFPGNMVLSMYGGLSESRMISEAKKHFRGFHKEGTPPLREVCFEKQERADIVTSRKGIKQTRIGIGFKTSNITKQGLEENAASIIASEMLDYRLFQELREKRGLSYESSCNVTNRSTFGFIGADAGVKANNLELTKKIMLKEFERAQNGEIEQKDFLRIKAGAIIEYTTIRERSLDMSIGTAMSSLIYDKPSLPLDIPKMLAAVTIDDVRAYYSKYIDVDRYGMFILKPK